MLLINNKAMVHSLIGAKNTCIQMYKTRNILVGFALLAMLKDQWSNRSSRFVGVSLYSSCDNLSGYRGYLSEKGPRFMVHILFAASVYCFV